MHASTMGPIINVNYMFNFSRAIMLFMIWDLTVHLFNIVLYRHASFAFCTAHFFGNLNAMYHLNILSWTEIFSGL